MKRTLTAIGLFLLAFAISHGSANPAKDSDPASLTGTWECVAHGSVQGDVRFTLTLKQNQETVTGSISTADGSLDITSGSFKDDLLQIRCETDQAKYTVTGKLKNGQLSGDWKKEGDDADQGGAWEGKRSAAQPSPSTR